MLDTQDTAAAATATSFKPSIGSLSQDGRLYRIAILDRGANVYIVNDAIRPRIVKSRLPRPFDCIILGDKKYFLEAIVDAVVILTIADRITRKLTLLEARLIPEFFTSLVSLQILNKKGIYYNTRN